MYRAQDVSIDAALTDFSLRYSNSLTGYIASKLAPIKATAKQSGKYPVYGSEHFVRVNTITAPGTRAVRHFQTVTVNSGSFYCDKHAVEEMVTPEETAQADPAINPAQDAVQLATTTLEDYREYLVATLTCTAGSYAAANKTTLSGTSQWSDYTSGVSDPMADIKTGLAAIVASSGNAANTAFCDYKTALTLANHPEVRDYGVHALGRVPQISDLNSLFQLNFLISTHQSSTTNPGQTIVVAPTWSTYFGLAYVNPNPGLKSATLALQFRWQSRRAEWYDDVANDCRFYRVIEYYDPILVGVSCGYLITGAIA